MNPQIISDRDQKPAFAVLPYDEYMALIERLELLEDLRDCQDFEERLARGEEELIPGDVVERLVEGENTVKVWREHRGLTQEELGAEIGLSGPYLSQIESGKREGTVKVYAALAKALGVDIDDLVATADRESPTRSEAAPQASGMKRSRDRGRG
jgi:DNA-binding XRE family transcriptional regulator